MFALHTPTSRMKGSGVLQGLKSLVDKLHPQLPLSPKESQRLLTALTTSFRQQLDRAHPRQVAGDEAKSHNGGVTAAPKPVARPFHASSVELADKHLASVLTNPLLSGAPKQDMPGYTLATAQESLLRDPFQDPVALLEEYNKHGAASIELAIMCLEKFQASIDRLSVSERWKMVSEREAGRRTLLWLWKNDFHKNPAFVDDPRMIDALVPLVLEEGHEEFLWEWLALDMVLGSQDQLTMKPAGAKRNFYKYRWRARIVRTMVATRLSWDQHQSADAALDTFFRAEAMGKKLVMPTAAMAGPVKDALRTNLRDMNHLRWGNTDVAKFDRFVQALSDLSRNKCLTEYDRANLLLYHPTHPTALPFLTVFQKVFSPDAQGLFKRLRERLEDPWKSRESARQFTCRQFLRAAALLISIQRDTDAGLVIGQLRLLYPDKSQVRHVPHHCQTVDADDSSQWIRANLDEELVRIEATAVTSTPSRPSTPSELPPFPTFA
jgi:hypothetical protein